MQKNPPGELNTQNIKDHNNSEYENIAINVAISFASLASILYLFFTKNPIMLWNWSLGLLFVFILPGYSVWRIFENNTYGEKSISLLRSIGLSLALTAFIIYILGLLKAINFVNVMQSIMLFTLLVNIINFGRNKTIHIASLKSISIRTMIIDLFSEARIKRTGLLLVIIIIINIVFRTWLAISMGIWRDGPFHTMVAQQIVNEGELVRFSPFNVVDVAEGDRTYWPVTYPMAYYLLLAIMYMLGGELGILIFSPLISSISILGVYIIAKHYFGTKVGILSACIFSIDAVTVFVSSSVYMDSLIVFFAILSIIEIERLVDSNRGFSPVRTGLWLGMLACIKQTGILTAISLVAYGLIIAGSEFKLKGNTRKLIEMLKTIIIAIGIAIPFLLYQYIANGSLLYPPFTIPFMNEKWVIDPESAIYLNKFRPEYLKPIYDVLYETLLYPFPLTIWGVITSTVLAVLAIFGLIYTIINRNKAYLTEFFVITSISVVFMKFFRLVIPRYFLILRVFSAIFVVLGIYYLQEHDFIKIPKIIYRAKISRSRRYRNKQLISYLFLFLVGFSLTYQATADIFIANASDRIAKREIQNRIELYQQAGQWIQQNTPENILILGGRAHEVAFYSQRDTVWIFWFGAHNVPKIFQAYTAEDALTYLANYNIDFIWLDRLQVANGFYELIPLHGLNDILGISPYFEKVFENNITRIYQVHYSVANVSSIYSRTHYYGSTLGSSLDFDKYQIIKLNNTNSWAKSIDNPGRKLGSNDVGYIEVQVDPNEFGVIGINGISSIPTSVTFYYHDTFWGNVQISILDQNNNYPVLLEIMGQNSGELRKITAICPYVYIDNIWSRELYGEEIISGSIHYRIQTNQNSEFPLLGMLQIPNMTNPLLIPEMVPIEG